MNRAALLVLALSPVLPACAAGAKAAAPAESPASDVAGVEAFNAAMIDATRRMDDAAIVALWEDDGVSLLPQAKPLEGKQAIANMIAEATSQHPGAHMESFEMRCHGIEVSFDVATEYCDEHQVVSFADGKPTFDGRGKVLFVLHRGKDGTWRLRREMWNQGAPTG